MYETMHARLKPIAEHDSDIERRIGAPCPVMLDILVAGGHELAGICLVDGENSLDEQTIDVRNRHRSPGETDRVYVVAIAHIALLCLTYPTPADERAAARIAAEREAQATGTGDLA